jgi:hypothetical protein
LRNISNLVRSQLPKFVREGNHEKFIAFIQAYYDFLEMQGNPNAIITSYNDLKDIDKTLDPFIQNFVESYAFAIPSRFFETKRDAIKHFKEINSIKGTPQSYKLLFQFLYDEMIDFYFPEIDILRTSDAKWDRRNVVAFTSSTFPNIVLKQVRSNNTKFLVTDIRLVDEQRNIYFAEFDPESFEGFFDDELDTLFWSEEDPSFLGWPIEAIAGIRIIEEGTKYKANYRFSINDGINRAVVNVDRVGPNGELRDLRVTSQNFRGNENTAGDIPPPPLPIEEDPGVPGSVQLIKGTFFIETYPPAETFNQPSGRSRIQDGFFYSPFTYVIKSGQSINLWKDMLYRMIHPAGMGLFSQVLILSVFRAGAAGGSSQSGQAQNTVFIYNWQVIDGILQFFQALKLFFSTQIVLSFVASPTLANELNEERNPDNVIYSYYQRDVRYFNQNKFLVPPYEEGKAGTVNVYRLDSISEGYEPPITTDWPDPEEHEVTDAFYIPDTWQHSNFRINSIEDMIIEMFTDYTKYKTNFQPGSFIRHHDVE